MEAAKSMLRTLDWAVILPTCAGGLAPTPGIGSARRPRQGGPARAAMAKRARADELGNATPQLRELGVRPARQRRRLRRRPRRRRRAGPVQYRTTFGGQTLNGAFTLWVRRPAAPRQDGHVAGLRSRQRHPGHRLRRCGAVHLGAAIDRRRRQRRLRPGQHGRPGGGSGPLPHGHHHERALRHTRRPGGRRLGGLGIRRLRPDHAATAWRRRSALRARAAAGASATRVRSERGRSHAASHRLRWHGRATETRKSGHV